MTRVTLLVLHPSLTLSLFLHAPSNPFQNTISLSDRNSRFISLKAFHDGKGKQQIYIVLPRTHNNPRSIVCFSALTVNFAFSISPSFELGKWDFLLFFPLLISFSLPPAGKEKATKKATQNKYFSVCYCLFSCLALCHSEFSPDFFSPPRCIGKNLVCIQSAHAFVRA